MDADLDGFLRAEFVKQKVALTVVLRREEAHFVMLGTSAGDEKRSWHEGWLTTSKDHAVGNVTLVLRSTGAMVWAGEAGDRNLFWGGLARGGQRKVAARLVKELKRTFRLRRNRCRHRRPCPLRNWRRCSSHNRPRPKQQTFHAVPGPIIRR
jgi:hypothetical protein